MKLKLLFLPRYHMNPDTHEISMPQHFPPLGIATLTGFLRKNNFNVDQDDLDIKVYYHNKKIKNSSKRINLEIFIDENRIEKFLKEKHEENLESEGEKILKLTNCKGYDIIGFSPNIMDNPSAGAILLILGKLIKEKYDVPIIMGTAIKWELVKSILSTGWIDYGIISSEATSIAEWNTLNFLVEFERGKNIEKIKGIMYIKNGEMVINNREYTIQEKYTITKPEFDGLPLHLYKRKLFCQVDSITYSSKIFFLPYFFIRGCPNACAFCCYSKQPWGAKKPEEVAEDLKELSKKYKTKNFFFLNTTINPTYDYANKIAEELIRNDVNVLWSDCATFNNMDKKLLKKLKEAGAIRLVFGMESGSPKILKFINKPFTVRDAETILKEMYRLKIMNQLDVICGLPYETEEDTNCTIKFFSRNRRYITGINLNKFYLSGLFQIHPEKYGLCRLPETATIHGGWSTIAFNEIYGLRWRKKVEQISKIYDKLKKVVDILFKPTMEAHDVFLFGSNPELLCKIIESKRGWKEGDKWVIK